MDPGPEGGEGGGRIIAEGTPEQRRIRLCIRGGCWAEESFPVIDAFGELVADSGKGINDDLPGAQQFGQVLQGVTVDVDHDVIVVQAHE